MLKLSLDDLEQHVAQLEKLVPDEETVRLTEIFMNTFDKIVENSEEKKMTIRELLRQLNQVAIDYEDQLDERLPIEFDNPDGGCFQLVGLEIVRSYDTGKHRLIVVEEGKCID